MRARRRGGPRAPGRPSCARRPEGFIAQRTILLSRAPDRRRDGRLEPRHVDLRPYVVATAPAMRDAARRADAGRAGRGRARRQLATRTAGRRPHGCCAEQLRDTAARGRRGGRRRRTRSGVEEEVMLLDPRRLAAWRSAATTSSRAWPSDLAGHMSGETHQAAIELRRAPHATVADAVGRARGPARPPADELDGAGARRRPPRACTRHGRRRRREVSPAGRYQLILRTMRELARREPTFALHVHVGVARPRGRAIRLVNRLRVHLPLLLALSANSPFWQGRAHRPGVDAHDALRRLPADGHPARASRPTRTGSATVGAAPALRRVPRGRRSCGGTSAPSRASARSRCG